MKLEPYDWTVVALGHWNRAILTPHGISRRLLKEPEGTPVQVEVPLDGIGPYRVRTDQLVISADFARLIVENAIFRFDVLGNAMAVAHRAVAELQETPLHGCGINIRYRVATPAPELEAVLAAPLDKQLADSNFEITGRCWRRSMTEGDGRINLEVAQDEKQGVLILVNLEVLSSDRLKVERWLQMPVSHIQELVTRLLRDVLGISAEIQNNEPNIISTAS